MELFPPRPRPRVNSTQLAITCLLKIAVNFGVALWMANDAELRRRQETTGSLQVYEPGPGSLRADSRPIPVRVKRSPWVENVRYLFVILSVNAGILGALGYVVLARYLEALRRYNLGLPTGFDEHRLKHRHFQRMGLATGPPLQDDPTAGDSPTSRFDWPS